MNAQYIWLLTEQDDNMRKTEFYETKAMIEKIGLEIWVDQGSNWAI